MKFCYIDESGSSDGRVVLAVGVIVDGSRMHLTKTEWDSLLDAMSRELGSPLREFKASDLYRGSGRWRGMAARDRGRVIAGIVDGINARKHRLVYAGILASALGAATLAEARDLPDAWCAADQHLLLAVQRRHKREAGTKGHTVVVIDQGGHQGHLLQFVRAPYPWTDEYYAKGAREARLSQIVDVPYFVDSEHAALVQTADLYAYVLRRYVELCDLADRERYAGEAAQVTGWARKLAARAWISDLWPSQHRTRAHEVFREITPPSLLALRP